MPKRKYDWSELKLQYFQSDIDDVSAFILQVIWKPISWWNNVKVKWWRQEKEAWKQKVIEKALKRNLEKKAKSLEIPVEVLQKWKKNALIWIMNQLTKHSDTMNMRDRVTGLNALKTELWEPTTVSKNENINRSEPLNESDFISD